jgi:hypothetical protein
MPGKTSASRCPYGSRKFAKNLYKLLVIQERFELNSS